MAYRMVYLRIQCNGYDPTSTHSADLSAFKTESRQLFQELGWTLHEGGNGISDTVTKDRQDLYLHPKSFSSRPALFCCCGQGDLYLHPQSFRGVLDEANIPALQEQPSRAQIF